MPLRSEFVAAECGDQHATSVRSPTFMKEQRLDELRDEAWQKGVVSSGGVDVAGGPIPRKPGYYGQPVVRPPVWTWEIPIYFFVGGLGGMSAVIALGAMLFHHFDVARTAIVGRCDCIGPLADSANFGSGPAASFHQHAARIQTAIGHVDGGLGPGGFWNVCRSRFDRAGASDIPRVRWHN